MGYTPKVMTAIPAQEWCWTSSVGALCRLETPDGSQVMWATSPSAIAAKRNGLANAFLKDERFSHICFLDSDMLPAPDTVMRLLAHRLPIVGALCFTRNPPFAACAGHDLPGGTRTRWLNEFGGPEPVKQVSWCGTGCLLISRDALLKVPRPWFDHAPGRPGISEDTYFCRKATKAGVGVYCDTSLCVGHVGITSIDLEHVLAWQNTAQAQQMIAQELAAACE
jgi:hypothetical protein